MYLLMLVAHMTLNVIVSVRRLGATPERALEYNAGNVLLKQKKEKNLIGVGFCCSDID